MSICHEDITSCANTPAMNSPRTCPSPSSSYELSLLCDAYSMRARPMVVLAQCWHMVNVRNIEEL